MSKSIPFEQSLTELEAIVKQLETGELTLENSLKQFEKGIALARRCQHVLHQAEQKIEIVSSPQKAVEPKSDEPSSD
jgi:exodeoxyribonuclease VII small subunit